MIRIPIETTSIILESKRVLCFICGSYKQKMTYFRGNAGVSAPTLQELMSLGGEAFSTWQGEISAILEQVGKGPKKGRHALDLWVDFC